MNSPRRTSQPPKFDSVAPEAAASMAKQVLQNNHRLGVPLGFLLIVEGTTDVAYLQSAAVRMRDEHNVDLLSLNDPDGNFELITICTPLNPLAQGNRGGTPQLIRLADDMKQHVLLFRSVGPVCFVLDHDTEGRGAAKTIRDAHKYTSDVACPITLEPKYHKNACRFCGKGERPIVIEDLLSLKIQMQFFEQGRRHCDASYADGEIVRFDWREPSKAELCEFVCAEASANDLREVARILVRVRELWRLSVPPAVSDVIDAPD